MKLPRKIYEGPDDTKIIIVGEAPGATEDREGKPFQGAAGILLSSQLAAAGIVRKDCFITNIAHEKPEGNEFSRFMKPRLHPLMPLWLLELKQDIQRIKPNVVLALGNWPLYILTGKNGITKWRGSILSSTLAPGTKVIPTYHPAAILRQWDLKVIADVDLRRVRGDSDFPELKLPERTYITDPPQETWEYYVERFTKAPIISFDIECATGDAGWYLICCGFADNSSHSVVFDCTKPGQLDIVRRILEGPAKKVAQNGQFDISFLAAKGVSVKNFWYDTMYAQHCCYPGLPKGLDFLASIHTREPYYKEERKLVGKAESHEQTLVYNGKDAAVTFEVMEKQEKEMNELDVWDIFHHEVSMVHPLMKMTIRGVQVDVALKDKMKADGEIKIKELTDGFNREIGKTVNVNSPKQVAELIYGTLKLPLRKNKTTGSPSTDEDTLVELYGKTGNGILRNIIEIRGWRKLVSTYLSLPVDADGAIRSEFKPAGTDSGRLSSSASIFGSGTNMQNIPESVRLIFIARPGKILIYPDLSQAEARCVAWECGDERLKELFRTEGIDIHKNNASRVFHKKLEDITTVERYLAKKLVHALNYGMGARRLQQVVNQESEKTKVTIDLRTAESLVKSYYDEFFLVKEWHRRIQTKMAKDRTLTNPFGRKRVFFGRWGEELFRVAYSWGPQSTVADRLNTSLVKIDRELPKVQLLVQVHDALVAEVNEADLDEVVPQMKELMEEPFELNGDIIKIPAEFKWGRNWGVQSEANPEGMRKYEKAAQNN